MPQLQSKEETIEFFLAELTKLKLEKARKKNGSIPSSMTENKDEDTPKDARHKLADSKSNSFVFWGANSNSKIGESRKKNGFIPSTISEKDEETPKDARPKLADSKSNSFMFSGWFSKRNNM